MQCLNLFRLVCIIYIFIGGDYGDCNTTDNKEQHQKGNIGNEQTIDMILASLLAGGHVLLEDVPGTGTCQPLFKG